MVWIENSNNWSADDKHKISMLIDVPWKRYTFLTPNKRVFLYHYEELDLKQVKTNDDHVQWVYMVTMETTHI